MVVLFHVELKTRIGVAIAGDGDYILIKAPIIWNEEGLKPIVPPFEYWLLPYQEAEISPEHRRISTRLGTSKLDEERKHNLMYLYAVGSIHEVTIEGMIAGANNV